MLLRVVAKVSKAFPYNSRCSEVIRLADRPRAAAVLAGPPVLFILPAIGYNDIDAKRPQFGAVDGSESVKSGLRCARRPIKRKRQCGRHGIDLDDSPPCLPKRGKKGIHDRYSSEDIDFEFATDSVKRQILLEYRRQDSSTVKEQIDPRPSVWT